ncbi:C2 domain-containing protein [Vulgatibacter sp.]|uniref:C2 domain-containing protein n=1 Tax=Vulgatibacter sp. TaxID=1971226 RepID=UPI003567A9CD
MRRWFFVPMLALLGCGLGSDSDHCDEVSISIEGECLPALPRRYRFHIEQVSPVTDVLADGTASYVAVHVAGRQVGRTAVREGHPEPVFDETLEVELQKKDTLDFFLFVDKGDGKFARRLHYGWVELNASMMRQIVYSSHGSSTWLRFTVEPLR